MKLDSIDRRLLAAIQVDSSQSAERLAGRVGISPSAAQRRLRRLRDSGVILKEIAVVSHEAVGRPLLLIVEVRVENEHEPDAAAFARRLEGAPEVMQCYYVTGRADYLLLCSFRDMSEYEAFSQATFVENPNVVSFETSVVIKPLKVGLQVPIG